MHSSKSYLFNILIYIAIFFVASNCQLKEINFRSDEAKGKWFFGNIEVTCNNKPQENVNISIFKLEESFNGDSYKYVVLNSSLTDNNGRGEVTGLWTIPYFDISCKMCLFHNCPPNNGQKGKKVGDYDYSYCFSFSKTYITYTLEEAQENDFDEKIELNHQSFNDYVRTSRKSNDCPSEEREE